MKFYLWCTAIRWETKSVENFIYKKYTVKTTRNTRLITINYISKMKLKKCYNFVLTQHVVTLNECTSIKYKMYKLMKPSNLHVNLSMTKSALAYTVNIVKIIVTFPLRILNFYFCIKYFITLIASITEIMFTFSIN